MRLGVTTLYERTRLSAVRDVNGNDNRVCVSTTTSHACKNLEITPLRNDYYVMSATTRPAGQTDVFLLVEFIQKYSIYVQLAFQLAG